MKRVDSGPVHRAVMRRSLSDVRQAIAEGGDVDALDQAKRTPLFYAAKDGDSEIVSELIGAGANVNLQDSSLKTALHFAAGSYRPDVVCMLLAHRAHVDAEDSHGNTPLSNAVFDSRGREDVIKILISFGANKTAKNARGVSPEDLAKTIGNYDITLFLK